MKITLKNIETEGNQKRVGFLVTEFENEKDKKTMLFAVDKMIDIVEGKTDEEYGKEAYTLAKTQIDNWIASLAEEEEESQEIQVSQLVGKEFDPNNNSFKE
jgi:hypothetical protein